MKKKSVKVNLNEVAAEELRRVAEELGIPQAEVLRRGLSVMRMYSELKKGEEGQRGALLIREKDETRELILA